MYRKGISKLIISTLGIRKLFTFFIVKRSSLGRYFTINSHLLVHMLQRLLFFFFIVKRSSLGRYFTINSHLLVHMLQRLLFWIQAKNYPFFMDKKN